MKKAKLKKKDKAAPAVRSRAAAAPGRMCVYCGRTEAATDADGLWWLIAFQYASAGVCNRCQPPHLPLARLRAGGVPLARASAEQDLELHRRRPGNAQEKPLAELRRRNEVQARTISEFGHTPKKYAELLADAARLDWMLENGWCWNERYMLMLANRNRVDAEMKKGKL